MFNNLLKESLKLSQYSRQLNNFAKLSKTQYQISKQFRQFSITNNLNQNLKYTETHEWLSESKEFTKVGLSKHAVEQLGDLIYIEPQYEIGEIVHQDDELVVIESVKAVDSIRAPFDCIIVENNENTDELIDSINQNPECVDNSWVIKIEEFNN
jgi:glycine cleavage system H protein